MRRPTVIFPRRALDLGATETQAFFKVVLPAISPGILSGFLMAFTLSIDDFVISYYTTGADFVTLPLKIIRDDEKNGSSPICTRFPP